MAIDTATTQTAPEQGGQAQAQTLEQLLASNPDYKSQFDALVSNQRKGWEARERERATEAKKLEAMSAEQRERYQFEQERKAFKQERDQFNRDQLKLQMGAELQRRGYDPAAAEWITGADAETSMANLTRFEAMFKGAMQNQLNNTMRGASVPAAPTTQPHAEADPFLLGWNSWK